MKVRVAKVIAVALGVVVATQVATQLWAYPETARQTMRECAELGIKRVWMHRSIGPGSVSNEAALFGREHGIQVIDGGCPLMFGPTSDPVHKVMRVVCTFAGTVPRQV